MATEKQVYQFELDAKNDKLRSSQRHRDGWRPISTSFTRNQWEIIWNNDPNPPPTVDEIKVKNLKVKLKNDSMTHKELLELLRLTGIIS